MLFEKKAMEELLCTLDEKGSIFSGFEIVKMNNQPKLLGTGGFSSVYEMRCPERPNNRYVLKVIGFDKHVVTSEDFWNTIRLQQYLTEHTQHVCRVISAKEINVTLDEEGFLQEVTEVREERWNGAGIQIQFMLMECLKEIISKDRLGKVILEHESLACEEEVIEFALQIGEALLFAHSNNILHRDVKLENIFWDEEAQCYKLGDFGLAKYTIEGNAETIVYTDGYGAPEIERQLYDYYNATADIYSFGITLYLLLNDLKFPGSEGYYVNKVQYNQEFIFPAPVNASEGMVRTIRKMCQYYQEDRYQSMAEVLMDIASLKNRINEPLEDEGEELPDFATETYREEKVINEELSKAGRGSIKNGRATRKVQERIENEYFKKTSKRYFLGLTVLLTLLMSCIKMDEAVVNNWQFWIFTATASVEAMLLMMREFHIIGGLITLIVGIYTGISTGFTVVQIMMIGALILGTPVVTLAGGIATAIWVALITSGKIQWLNVLKEHKLSWLIIIIILVYVLIRYLFICIGHGLALHDILYDQEEQINEDEMDDGRDGEHPDATE